MPGFASRADFNSWLAARGMFHMRLGLRRMTAAMRILNLENPPFPIIQVLGTNGKGSTCAFLDSLGRAHGLKTGLFTSPHFVSAKERVLIAGRQPGDDEWLAAANAVISACGQLDLTYFEFLTVMAAFLFREHNVDMAIMEAGLGGANDATTALPASVHCFTPIALDHAAIIGPSLADIAGDKSRAIKPGSRVFSAAQYPRAAAVLRRQAALRKAALHYVDPLPAAWLKRLGLAGEHQLANAGLALEAWHCLACKNEYGPDSAGLASAFLPGRLQLARPEGGAGAFILDGAHNPHGMQSLLKSLKYLPSPKAAVFSCLADKDWRTSLAMLARTGLPLHVPRLGNDRAANAEEVAKFYDNLAPGKARAFSGTDALRKALAAACAEQGEGPALLTGSLYLLSEFFSLYPECLNPGLPDKIQGI